MDKQKLFKIGASVGLMVLTGVTSLLNSRAQDVKMKETIAKEVAEALKNQTEES